MFLKTSIALIAATFAMTSMETSAFAGSKRFSANGGNGGSGNLVIGNGNRVGNGGRGGNVLGLIGGLAGLGGKHRSSANGGNGGNLNIVIGNNNTVGNGGNGGNVLDIDD